MIRRTGTPFLAAFLVLAALLTGAQAQLIVDLNMGKKVYVAYEPMDVTVTVMNRSGQDIVLAGPNKTSWLSFEIQRDRDLVPPRATIPATKPFLLRDGESMQKKITLNQIYPMGDYGTYQMRASVYLPTFQKFYSSGVKKVNVTSGNKVWKQEYGRRDFATGRANLREYSLLTHNTGSTSELYVRVRDQNNRKVLTTYSIGKLVNVGDPQVTLDRENNLHVLHMGAPRSYAHTIIDGEGKVLKQELYRDGSQSRPSLKINQAGGVRVAGGVPLDPEKQAAIVDDAAKKMVRRASERPAGLPKF